MPRRDAWMGALEPRRAANLRVRQLADELADDPVAERWRFFCECGEPGCTALVPLRAEEFDALIRDGRRRVLAAGHTRASRRAPAAA